MSTYKELLAQRQALEDAINKARNEELSKAISDVRAIVAEYDLTADDVFGGRKGGTGKPTKKVAPKYRDPATGQTWTGRGKAPVWIAGAADREAFAIKD